MAENPKGNPGHTNDEDSDGNGDDDDDGGGSIFSKIAERLLSFAKESDKAAGRQIQNFAKTGEKAADDFIKSLRHDFVHPWNHTIDKTTNYALVEPTLQCEKVLPGRSSPRPTVDKVKRFGFGKGDPPSLTASTGLKVTLSTDVDLNIAGGILMKGRLAPVPKLEEFRFWNSKPSNELDETFAILPSFSDINGTIEGTVKLAASLVVRFLLESCNCTALTMSTRANSIHKID